MLCFCGVPWAEAGGQPARERLAASLLPLGLTWPDYGLPTFIGLLERAHGGKKGTEASLDSNGDVPVKMWAWGIVPQQEAPALGYQFSAVAQAREMLFVAFVP